jgi:hypothetical protein
MMPEWKMPPKAKIYEALSAFADGRVHIRSQNEADVTSSTADKEYSVTWSDDMKRIRSNDNASYWQGYAGYPVVAVLLALGRIDFNAEIAKSLAGVPWKRINDRFKRDYDKAVDCVLEELEAKGVDKAAVIQQVESIYAQLAALKIERGPRTTLPPK